MNAEAAIDLLKQVVLFALYVTSPFIVLMLLIGLLTSLAQSVTSIQEQTLTFGPKILGLALLLIVLAPWLLRALTEFASSCITRMAIVAG
ncbi:flagellar biosynthetic protein FliQ [Termitidicoccus mucosus]|uniref:Flagellar biosynthetic protein FliQ n=1 Tax=Termitidicoccus mucosus TaxID=1184151 RepID=A0A178IF62_9BACT|nr:flagellar biosynthetic protein FliQ [Opitutaceae bacterium TSB47]